MLNKKRILAAALALAMAASMLTACGGKGKQEGAAGAAGLASAAASGTAAGGGGVPAAGLSVTGFAPPITGLRIIGFLMTGFSFTVGAADAATAEGATFGGSPPPSPGAIGVISTSSLISTLLL